MLPDAPWENTRFTANPAQIHSQDLIIEEEKKGKKEEEEEEQLYDFENSTFDPKDLPTGTPVATRVGDKLPDAENFLQLIEFGLNNHVYCTNVICELLEQLYHTDDTNVLIVVDGYSEFFKPSAYPSVKYENFKPCQGKIPPHDIALSRAFMRFDGHMIKNGVKVVATSENTFVRDKNKCTGEHLFIDSGFEMSVPYLALNDFRKAVHHYRMTSWTFQEFDEPEIEDVYMMSQGNWTLAQQNLKFYNYELW